MAFTTQIPPWALMWIIALALYATAKTATLATLRSQAIPATRKIAYLLFFPGMNAATFCAQPSNNRPRASIAPTCAANILLGALLLWKIAPLIHPRHQNLQGWIGMIGLVLTLHFGLLQFPALAWQLAGYRAPLLMNRPIRSASVTEFWNSRWNTAFHQLSCQFIFKPLARRSTPAIALLATFTISGLLHDLVISLPAGAGFGLPTAYFLLQGLCVLFERTSVARRLLNSPPVARGFTLMAVGLPAPLLFHPPFVTRVFLPFMSVIGALPQGAHP